jgi:hypothetical protein
MTRELASLRHRNSLTHVDSECVCAGCLLVHSRNLCATASNDLKS